MNYELIIFDCDGVLVDSEPLANTTFAAEVRKLGIPFTDEEAKDQFPGTTLAKCIEYVEKKFSVTLPENIGDIYRAASFVAFTKYLKPVHGVQQILDELLIAPCVGSNGPKSKILHNLDIVDFLDYFGDRLYSAYEINRFKPDPGIFLHAARDMNVEPEKCIVIEDSIHGFEAGVEAGMKVLAYDPHSKSKRLKEVEYYTSMYDIYKSLQNLGVLQNKIVN